MKIKTISNREIDGKKTTPEKKRVRRKPAVNQKPRLSARVRIAAAFRFFGRVFVPVVLLAFMFICGIYALKSDAFDLGDVIVSGCRHQDAKALAGIIREEFPANILRIDLDAARRRLEKETWVRRVELHRILPSSLLLRVEERTPAVLLELGGVQMMADGEGVLLGPYRREFGKIDSPIFRGVSGANPEAYAKHYEENAGRIRRGIAMLAEIAAEMPQNVRDISEIDISELSNIKIMMDNDPVEIWMGNGNYLKRFSSFVEDPTKKYQELKNQGIQVAQIDLSNDGQIVYKSFEAVARERSLGSGRPINR
jgi:cell division septal protein FtsQ